MFEFKRKYVIDWTEYKWKKKKNTEDRTNEIDE